MKKLLILLLSFITTTGFASSVVFYNTFADYSSKKGEVVGEYEKLSVVNSLITLKVNDGSKSVRYRNEELDKIWGFEAGGIVYRVKNDNVYEVVYIGKKIFIYEGAFLRMSYNKPDYVNGQDKIGSVYFSMEPETIMNNYSEDKGEVVSYLIKTYPQLKKQFECINSFAKEYRKKFYFTNVIKCLKEYDNEN